MGLDVVEKNEIGDVRGCAVSFHRHGDPAGSPLVLLHCGGGHSGWWSELIPQLANEFHVVTMDLSGHGDSGRRDIYQPELWADEVGGVVDGLGRGPVTLIGHSMGALVGIYAAALHPTRIERLLVIDPPVRDVELRDVPVRTRIYPRAEVAIERFQLRPPGTTASPDVLTKVARGGLHEVPDGWAWKFDPRASQRFTVEGVADALSHVACPTACIYAEFSPFVNADTVAYIEGLLGRSIPSEEIAGAYHHLVLDAPEAVAAAIRRLIPILVE